MAVTFTSEVAPSGGCLLPWAAQGNPSSGWGAAGNMAGEPLPPLLQGGLNPGLGEWTCVLGKDMEAGRSEGLQVSKDPPRRFKPQIPQPRA